MLHVIDTLQILGKVHHCLCVLHLAQGHAAAMIHAYNSHFRHVIE